jgi:tetratricopeptide (TPR) repeat protein
MKLLILFITASSICGSAFAQSSINCSSRQVQDSLFQVYSRKAHAAGFDSPGWDQAYDNLLQICPNIAEAYQEKGLPHIARRNLEKVFEYNDQAVALDPQRWTAYRGYLHCLLAKNYEKAIADFEAAEKLTPNAFTMDHTFSFFTALSYMELGNYEKAETYFLKDIAQQKRGEGKNDIHYNTLLYFGIMYYLQNEMDKAESRLRECLQLYEQHPTANYYLAMIMKITGNKQAKSYFEKARQYMEEGYQINEPNTRFVPYPRQVTLADIPTQ